MKIGKLQLAIMAATLAAASTSTSAQITFTATGTAANGEALDAMATFQTLPGNELQITLANIETGDAHTVANVLSAIFFDGATGLTPVSAIVPAGNLQWDMSTHTTLSSDLNVGTEWGYAYTGGSGSENLGANPPYNATAGISSAGFGWFGHGDFAANGVALDGAAYGLVPLGFRTTGGSYDGFSNANNNPVFENTVVLTLSGWTGNVNAISNVFFQYGTEITDANIVPVPVPEPTMGGCFLLGLGALACFQRFTQNRRS